MTREDIIRMAREAGWSGIYTQWREPDGSPDWTPVKESLTVPVTMEQIERFAALVAAAEREWVGLTEKEVKAIANKRNDYGLPMTGRMWVFVADLTDKLKEKNHG